jgi:hypothetical protein
MRSLQAVSKAVRWIVVVGVVGAMGVATASAGSPPARRTSVARAARAWQHQRVEALAAKARRKPKLGGLSFGGLTPQQWPVVIQVSRNLKNVTRAIIGLDENCTPSGDLFGTSDFYGGRRDLFVPMNKAHKFSAAFGPISNPSPPAGTTQTAQGSISGKLNRALTKASGTWQLTFISRNATTGAVVDTCDSGLVHWTATQ